MILCPHCRCAMDAHHECESVQPSRRFFISSLLGTAAALIVKPRSANVEAAVKALDPWYGAGAFGFDREWRIIVPVPVAVGEKQQWRRIGKMEAAYGWRKA